MAKFLIYISALIFVLYADQVFAAPGNPIPENVGIVGDASFPGYASYPLTTNSTKILLRDPYRNYLLIQNTGGTNNAVIRPDGPSSAASDGIILTPGASYAPSPALIDSFWAQAATSTTTLTVIQGSK